MAKVKCKYANQTSVYLLRYDGDSNVNFVSPSSFRRYCRNVHDLDLKNMKSSNVNMPIERRYSSSNLMTTVMRALSVTIFKIISNAMKFKKFVLENGQYQDGEKLDLIVWIFKHWQNANMQFEHIYARTYMHVHTCTHIHARTYMYAHTCTHIHSRTYDYTALEVGHNNRIKICKAGFLNKNKSTWAVSALMRDFAVWTGFDSS